MKKLRNLEIFSFGCGEISTNILFSFTTVLLVFFYTDVVGVSAAAVGAIIGVSQIFNGLSDVAAGIIIDRTKSKYGRARPWMLRMSIPYAIAFILLVTVPKVGEFAQLIYIFITYNLLMTVVYTMLVISFSTLLTLITWDQKERNKLCIVRMAMSPIANIAVTLTFLKIVNAMGGGQGAWIKATAVYALIAAGLMLFAFFMTKERVQVPEGEHGEHIPVKVSLQALLHNKYFWIVTLYFIFFAVYMTFNGTMMTYYCKYILHNEELLGTINMAGQVVMLVGTPLTGALLHRTTKKNICMVGCGLIIVGSVILPLAPHSVALVIVSSFIRGLGISATYALIYLMVADVVEYGYWKNGVRTPGVIESSASCGQKFGSGLGSALLGWIMERSGYIGTAAVQTESAVRTIYNLYVYGIIVVAVVMIAILLFYHLDKEYPTIMKELMERNKQPQA